MTTLRPELLGGLLSDYETPENLLGDEGLFKQLKKARLERALGAELTDHLGYEKAGIAARDAHSTELYRATGRKFCSGCSTAWPPRGRALRSEARWISPRCRLWHRSCRMRWVRLPRRAQDGSPMTRIGERPMRDRHGAHRKRGNGSDQLDLFAQAESSVPEVTPWAA